MPKYSVSVNHNLIGSPIELNTSGDIKAETPGKAIDDFIGFAIKPGHEVTYVSVTVDEKKD